jgi:hypothetical protein
MDRSLTWSIDEKDGSARVTLSGELTENSNLAALLEKCPAKVVFDLAGIQRINSPGVREWINFVNALDKRAATYSHERCSVPFVNQLNMISNFRGKGDVKSIFAPYFCTDCSREEARLIEAGPNAGEQLRATLTCPHCGGSMEFDDLPDAYLAFWS